MNFATARVAPEKPGTSTGLPIVFMDDERTIMKMYDIEIEMVDGELFLTQGEHEDDQAVIRFSKEQVGIVAKLMIQAVAEGEPITATRGFDSWCDNQDKKCATTAL